MLRALRIFDTRTDPSLCWWSSSFENSAEDRAIALAPGRRKVQTCLRSQSINNFTYHWSVHVPECSFLTVENFPLNFVSLLVHSEMGVGKKGVQRSLILKSTSALISWCHHTFYFFFCDPSESSGNQKEVITSVKVVWSVCVCVGLIETYFACASACIKMNSHFRAKALCSLAKLSCKCKTGQTREEIKSLSRDPPLLPTPNKNGINLLSMHMWRPELTIKGPLWCKIHFTILF